MATNLTLVCWQKQVEKRTAKQIDQIAPISTSMDGTLNISFCFPMIEAKDRQDVLVFQATGQKRRSAWDPTTHILSQFICFSNHKILGLF